MGNPWPIMLMVRELGIGGCERDLTKLALGLDRSQFTPYVGCFIDEGLRSEELRDAGIPVVQVPVTSFRSWTMAREMVGFARWMRRQGIRLIQCFDTPTVLFGIPAATLGAIPVRISSQLSFRELYSPAEHRLLRWTDRLSTRVVANSRAVQSYLVEQEKIPASRTFLSYNGVDTSRFRPCPQRTRPAALAGASTVIGTVAALRPEKNIQLVVEAFAEVLTADPNLRLLIVGSGPELASLQAAARRLAIEHATVFQPAVSDVVPWLHAIDIFVQASTSESFPNAVLEAMACGCAPVASRVGGVPELVLPEQTGLLFESGDRAQLATHLRTLVLDAQRREQFSAAAVGFVHSQLSMAQAVARMQAFYHQELEKGARYSEARCTG